VPYPLGDGVEEKKTTSKTAVAISETKEVLKAMLGEACQDEHITEEMEERIVEGLYGFIKDAVFAYAACRAYAWSGLGVSYELKAIVDCVSISATMQRHSNSQIEMDLSSISLFLQTKTLLNIHLCREKVFI
jgi:hypothetical protein